MVVSTGEQLVVPAAREHVGAIIGFGLLYVGGLLGLFLAFDMGMDWLSALIVVLWTGVLIWPTVLAIRATEDVEYRVSSERVEVWCRGELRQRIEYTQIAGISWYRMGAVCEVVSEDGVNKKVTLFFGKWSSLVREFVESQMPEPDEDSVV